jgi:hypothetical protein
METFLAFAILTQSICITRLNGKPVDDLIPVCRRGSLDRVAPTKEYAEMLKRRLDFIDKHILSGLNDELRQ